MEDKEQQIRMLAQKYNSLKDKSGILKSRSKFIYATSVASLVLTLVAIFTGNKALTDIGFATTLGLATVGFVEGAHSHLTEVAAQQVSEDILNLKEDEERE